MLRVPALELIPIGAGAAFGLPGQSQSSYLVRGGRSAVCFDLGSGTFNHILGTLDPTTLDAIVISHLHPDHFADLLALRVYMAHGPGLGYPLNVYSPPGLLARLDVVADGESWAGIRFHDLAAGEGRIDAGELCIRHAEVPHLPPTHASRVEFGGRSITYGADCAPGDALPTLAEGTDVLVLECTFGTGPIPEGVPHLNACTAGEIARRAGAGRLLLVHGYPGIDREASVAEAADIFGGPVEWARDGVAVTA
ncbi:MAG: MBL fold metallo-hydrolase [Thermoleophilia bacterium]|nr:MBL fold metallo-hydrolase [Thermoleophilia bacterium]